MDKPYLVENEKHQQVFFTDVKDGQCKYPLWPDTQKIGNVCGKPTLGNSSWCFDHFHIVSDLSKRRV